MLSEYSETQYTTRQDTTYDHTPLKHNLEFWNRKSEVNYSSVRYIQLRLNPLEEDMILPILLLIMG